MSESKSKQPAGKEQKAQQHVSPGAQAIADAKAGKGAKAKPLEEQDTVKLEMLRHAGGYSPGDIVEVSQEEAAHLTKVRHVKKGLLLEEIRNAKPYGEKDENARKPGDVSGLSQSEAKALGLKNVVDSSVGTEHGDPNVVHKNAEGNLDPSPLDANDPHMRPNQGVKTDEQKLAEKQAAEGKQHNPGDAADPVLNEAKAEKAEKEKASKK